METYRYEWICNKCNYNFGIGPSSRHLMFGFQKPCPKCGESQGSEIGNSSNSRRELVRYIRTIKFNIFNIKTWFVKYKREIKK